MGLAPLSGFHSDSAAARQELSSFWLDAISKEHKEEQNLKFMKPPFTLCSILTVAKCCGILAGSRLGTQQMSGQSGLWDGGTQPCSLERKEDKKGHKIPHRNPQGWVQPLEKGKTSGSLNRAGLWGGKTFMKSSSSFPTPVNRGSGIDLPLEKHAGI